MHIRLSSRWAVAALLLLVPVALFANPPLDDDGMPPMFIAKGPVGTALGTATEAVDGTVSLPGVTIPAGSTLIVCYGELSADPGFPVDQPTSATFDGNNMTFLFLSGDGDEGLLASAMYYYYAAAATSGTISITSSNADLFAGSALTARSWTRISSSSPDENIDISNSSTATLTMDFAGTATDILVAAAAYRAAPVGTWQSPMIAGQSATVSDLKLAESYLSPVGAATQAATITFASHGGEISCGISVGFLRAVP